MRRVICPECRHELTRVAQFCPTCGMRVINGGNSIAVTAVAVFGFLSVVALFLALS